MAKQPTIDQATKRWIELKAASKEIEKEMGELKPIIEDGLSVLIDQRGEFHGWEFALVSFERESFSLSKAREKLDGRVLAPYISKTDVVQIRMNWRGGEAEAA